MCKMGTINTSVHTGSFFVLTQQLHGYSEKKATVTLNRNLQKIKIHEKVFLTLETNCYTVLSKEMNPFVFELLLFFILHHR